MIICVIFNSFTADELKLSHRPRVLARSLWLQKPGSAWGHQALLCLSFPTSCFSHSAPPDLSPAYVSHVPSHHPLPSAWILSGSSFPDLLPAPSL